MPAITETTLPLVLTPPATEPGSAADAHHCSLADLGVRLGRAATTLPDGEGAVRAVLEALLIGSRASTAFRLIFLEGQWVMAEQLAAAAATFQSLPVAALAGAAESAMGQGRAVQFALRAGKTQTVVAIAPLAASEQSPAVVGATWEGTPLGPDARGLAVQLAAISIVQANRSRAQQQAGASAPAGCCPRRVGAAATAGRHPGERR